MSDGSGAWYVRARGRVIGPFTLVQLESLRDRGQLARFHEISQDRQNWTSAAGLPGLFAHVTAGAESTGYNVAASGGGEPAPSESGNNAAQEQSARTAEDSSNWFFARDGAQQGPVRFYELQRMAYASEIGPATLVWTKGMANWAPAAQVSELRFPVVAATRAPAHGSAPAQAISTGMLADQPARISGLAIASLVLGIVWLCGLGSLLATIFGAVALSQITRSRGSLEGKGLAIAGLILGIIGLTVTLLQLFTGFLTLGGLGAR